MIEYVKYEKKYKEEVVAVLQECFDKSFSKERFEWKHELNPFGESYGGLAIDESGVVGCNFFLKTEFRLNDHTYLMLRSCESAVHPRGRRKGIFSNIISWANSEYGKGVAGFFGTPNDQSSEGFKKLGWGFIPPITMKYFLFVGGLWKDKQVEVMPVSSFPDRAFKSSLADRLAVNKSTAYFLWRYHPLVGDYKLAFLPGEPSSFVIYKIIHKKGIKTIMLYELEGTEKNIRKIVASVSSLERSILFHYNSNYHAVDLGLIEYKKGASEFIYNGITFDKELLSKLSLSIGDLDKIL